MKNLLESSGANRTNDLQSDAENCIGRHPAILRDPLGGGFPAWAFTNEGVDIAFPAKVHQARHMQVVELGEPLRALLELFALLFRHIRDRHQRQSHRGAGA